MTVLIIATGDTETHNASYCARLIEQGIAVPIRKDGKNDKRKKRR